MAIVGHSLLLAVCRVLSGIQVDDQPLSVLPSQEGVGGWVRASSKASNPMELPRTLFSKRESMD